MKWSFTPLSYAQRSKAWPVNSGPLSITTPSPAPLPSQQHVEPSVSPSRPLLRQDPQPRAQLLASIPCGDIANRRFTDPDQPARPALTDRTVLSDELHRRAPLRGRHHFFPSTAFKARLSSVRSATRCFSFRFSSSSSFSRR